MAAGTVTGHSEAGGVGTIGGGVLLEVGEGSEDILDECGHGVRRLVAVGGADPAVIDAGDDILAALDELTGEGAHDVLGVGGPAAAVDDDDRREVPGAVWREHVVLQRLYAGLRVDDVLLHGETLERLRINEGGADALVAVRGDLDLGARELLETGKTPRDGVVHAVDREARSGRRRDSEDGAGSHLAVGGESGSDGDRAILGVPDRDGERGGCGVGRSRGRGGVLGAGREAAEHEQEAQAETGEPAQIRILGGGAVHGWRG